MSSIDESITAREIYSFSLTKLLTSNNFIVILIVYLIYLPLNQSPLNLNWLFVVTFVSLTHLFLWTINSLEFKCLNNFLIVTLDSSSNRLNQLTKQQKQKNFSFKFILTIYLIVITSICCNLSVPVTGYAIKTKRSLEQSIGHFNIRGTSLQLTRNKINFNKHQQQLNAPNRVDKVDGVAILAKKLDTNYTSMSGGPISTWIDHRATINYPTKGKLLSFPLT